MIWLGVTDPITLKQMMLKKEQMKSIMVHMSNGIFTFAKRLNINLVIKCKTRVALNKVPR